MTCEFLQKELSGRRFLVVEDRYLVADDLQRLLKTHGADVVALVSDIEQAKAIALSGDVDLALLDVDLRGQHVFDVAAILDARGVPFVFVTGYPQAHLPEKYRARPSVTKPFTEPELLARIGEALQGGAVPDGTPRRP